MAMKINPDAFSDEEGIALVRTNLYEARRLMEEIGCPDRWFIEGMALVLREIRLATAANDTAGTC